MNPQPPPDPGELQPLPPAPPQPGTFYEHLRQRVLRWAERQGQPTAGATEALIILPDMVRLLAGLIVDTDVPPKNKAKNVVALLYILSPLDFLPEAIFGPVSYLDDLIVAVFVLDNLLNRVDPEVVLRHWKGDGDAIKTIRHYVAVADELAGSGLLKRIKRFLEG
jgi:uncharacterized membrane protein YkvA (DUF1232 family)